jgi:hypothetical protein
MSWSFTHWIFSLDKLLQCFWPSFPAGLMAIKCICQEYVIPIANVVVSNDLCMSIRVPFFVFSHRFANRAQA